MAPYLTPKKPRIGFSRAALVVSLGIGMAVVGVASADITDPTIPTTQTFLPTDQVQGIVRNGHQNLAGQLWQQNAALGHQVASCTASSSASCTASLSTAYTQAPPVCIAEDVTGFIVAHATASTNAKVLLITGGSSSSDTYLAQCDGNKF